MRRLTALAAVAILAGCGSGTSHQAGLAIRVDTNPFRLTVVRDGKVVVSESKDARLRYQLISSNEQHRLTRVLSSRGNTYEVATDEAGRTATGTVTRIRGGFHVSLRLHPATNVQQVYDSFEAHRSEHFLGGGERTGGVDLAGQILPVKVSYLCGAVPVPYFASTAGWGVRLDSENVAGLAFPGSSGGAGCQYGGGPQCTFPALADRAEVCVIGAQLDEDIYAGTLEQTLADYEAATGRPRVPPPSELALVKWRDVVDGPAQVLEDVTRLRAAGIPIGWVLLDNPWEPCSGDLVFDRRRIPDPAGLIRQVHSLGVKFMLWVSPRVFCGGGGYPRPATLGAGGKYALDLRQPAIAAEFRARLKKVFAFGVDGVKGDRGDDVDLAGAGATVQNEYPLLFAHDVLAELPPDAAAIFRAGTVGSQSVLPGLWAGDQSGDFSGLQQAILLGESAAMSGFPTWGSDVGGFSSSPTPEVFARWAQLGAVSPVMEVGGTGANSTPWTLGATAMTALQDAAVLHYELFPYFYGLLQRRQPVLRPLGYAFPGDPGAWQAQYEFLVGPDLLAAPVVGGGTTPSVYLPRGLWVDLYSGRTVKGPVKLTRPTPLPQFPLYARAGAVVPFNLRTADSWWGVDELTHPGRAGYLVSDGSGLDLHGQPHDVQLFVPAGGRPRRVTFGGRPVPWSWQAAPFPGVVVRVHGPVVRGEIVLLGA